MQKHRKVDRRRTAADHRDLFTPEAAHTSMPRAMRHQRRRKSGKFGRPVGKVADPNCQYHAPGNDDLTIFKPQSEASRFFIDEHDSPGIVRGEHSPLESHSILDERFQWDRQSFIVIGKVTGLAKLL